MGTNRLVATATGIATMGVVGPRGIQEMTAPSPVVEVPLMGMAIRPMVDTPPVHQITGCLTGEAIPQAEALGSAGTATTAEVRAGPQEGHLIRGTVDAADRAVHPMADPTEATVMGTDPTVTNHGAEDLVETVMEEDPVVPLMTLRAIRIAPERSPGLASRRATRPGSARSRTRLTCPHFPKVQPTASLG